ncbi:MAG: RDD family protein [Marmoricola sp.]
MLGTPGASWVTLGIFWAETALGTAIAGGSFGQLATRIRVFKITGGPIGLLPAMLRSLLVCLVVPPLIFKADGRGLHDLAVGSGVYKL